MNNDEQVYLTRESARQVSKFVRQLERTPKGDVRGTTGNRSKVPHWIATTSASIPPRSGMTMGSGAVACMAITPAGVLSTSTAQGLATKAWNFTGGTIASGTLVIIVSIYDLWVIIAADCSASSNSGTSGTSGTGSGTSGTGTGTGTSGTTTGTGSTTPTTTTVYSPYYGPTYATVTSAYTMTSSDAGLVLDTSGGSFSVTLPTGSDARIVALINASSSANPYTIAAAGTDMIVPSSTPVSSIGGNSQGTTMTMRYCSPSAPAIPGWYLM